MIAVEGLRHTKGSVFSTNAAGIFVLKTPQPAYAEQKLKNDIKLKAPSKIPGALNINYKKYYGKIPNSP
ncbi:MAG: hypothetical protein ACKVOM_00025 [Ferruginibacter sp.]